MRTGRARGGSVEGGRRWVGGVLGERILKCGGGARWCGRIGSVGMCIAASAARVLVKVNQRCRIAASGARVVVDLEKRCRIAACAARVSGLGARLMVHVLRCGSRLC